MNKELIEKIQKQVEDLINRRWTTYYSGTTGLKNGCIIACQEPRFSCDRCLSEQIHSLYKQSGYVPPQGDKDGLIPVEQFCQLVCGAGQCSEALEGCYKNYSPALKAQKALDDSKHKEQIEGIFKELRSYSFAVPQYIPQNGTEPVIICLSEEDLRTLEELK